MSVTGGPTARMAHGWMRGPCGGRLGSERGTDAGCGSGARPSTSRGLRVEPDVRAEGQGWGRGASYASPMRSGDHLPEAHRGASRSCDFQAPPSPARPESPQRETEGGVTAEEKGMKATEARAESRTRRTRRPAVWDATALGWGR